MAKKKTDERHRMTQKERFHVYEFLKKVLVIDGEFCDYIDKWTDQSVADHFSVSKYGVQYIRQEAFGKLRLHEGSRDDKLKTNKISDLEKRITALENCLKEELGINLSR